MTLAELDDQELLVFVGLVRILMNADDVVSLEEMTYLRGLTEAIGRDQWHSLAHQTRRFGGLDGVLDAAEKVSRAEARDLIKRELLAIAESDELVDAEQAVLDRLDRLWS